MQSFLGILFVLATLGIAMGGIKLYDRLKSPNPEIPRKMVHILMGCVTLTFPSLFSEVWPVLLLGILSTGLLTAVRMSKTLKGNVGSVLHGVERHSFGELYFPIAVTLLFLLSRNQPILYYVPILMLTFADSTAALIGASYGRKALAQGTEDAKSLEGSFVFFNVAFMSTLAPLLLFTSVGRAETLLISLVMGVLAALIELISQDGNDNLFIPLIGYAFLKLHMNMNNQQLIQSLVLLAILFLFGRFWNKRGSLSRLGVLGGLVGAYATALLGGWTWLLIMLLAFVTYPIVPKMTEEEKKLIMDYPVLASNVAVGLFWVWLGFVLEQSVWGFNCFVLAFSGHQAMNMHVRLVLYHKATEKMAFLKALLKSSVTILMPAALVMHYNFKASISLGVIGFQLLALMGSIFAVNYFCKRYDYTVADAKNGWRNAGVVALFTIGLYLFERMFGS